MTRYEQLQQELRTGPRTWLVTGAAGFIGSHLVEKLLTLNQQVVGLDNLSTGKRQNLDEVRSAVGTERWKRFRFVHGDTRNAADCLDACHKVDFVLHQGALGSVPRSLSDPVATHSSNVTGFLNILVAARDSGASRLIYASSSSVYGDHPRLPKVETEIGKPLSPYAATKRMNEIYADVFRLSYGFPTIGLRYFNVFGPRQDPAGAYAAVIPCWFNALRHGQPTLINGDGETSRDFCYIENVVQANLLAAGAIGSDAEAEIYNVACGERTTLNQLFKFIREEVTALIPAAASAQPVYQTERVGDIRHSLADISRVRERLGYSPQYSLRTGLQRAAQWYLGRPE